MLSRAAVVAPNIEFRASIFVRVASDPSPGLIGACFSSAIASSGLSMASRTSVFALASPAIRFAAGVGNRAGLGELGIAEGLPAGLGGGQGGKRALADHLEIGRAHV